jgi:hypothetical protein
MSTYLKLSDCRFRSKSGLCFFGPIMHRTWFPVTPCENRLCTFRAYYKDVRARHHREDFAHPHSCTAARGNGRTCPFDGLIYPNENNRAVGETWIYLTRAKRREIHNRYCYKRREK